MQGSVRAMLGIMSGVVSQRRISEASRRVAPHAFQARTFDTLQRTNPIPYFAPYFGYKRHFDQNEKVAQTFGMANVYLIDGCSRFILGAVTMPIKNPILIYEHLAALLFTKFSEDSSIGFHDLTSHFLTAPAIFQRKAAIYTIALFSQLNTHKFQSF